MDMQSPAVTEEQLSPPALNLGKDVRILRGEHRGVNGYIIACEWNSGQNDWIYFVTAGRAQYGPYTAKELW